MAEVRCGVAGLGRGKLFVSILEKIPGCRVVAVCDPNPVVLGEFGRYKRCTDYDELLDTGLDLVAVISPGPEHAAQSVKALGRGAHVLCETPCVYSVAEAEAVIRAVRRSGRKYMLAENYIWMGWFETLRQWHREGRFGTIIYAEGDYTHDCRDIMLLDDGKYIAYRERERHPKRAKSWRATHLPPLSYSSHTLGPLLTLMGDRAVESTALSAGGRTTPDLGTVDLEVGILKTAGGAAIRLTNGFTVAHPMALHYKIVGTRGSAVVTSMDSCTIFHYSDADAGGSSAWQSLPVKFGPRADGKDSAAAMTEEFVGAIVRGTPAPIDEYQSMDMVVPGVLAHESAMAGGRTLAVPDFRRL
jgi:predicted dehydrogenase